MTDLFRQGLIISGLGMGLVFAALLLLWGVLALMGALSRSRLSAEERAAHASSEPAVNISTVAGEPVVVAPGDVILAADEQDALTQERAQVAAIVAGALLANALPILFDVPAGPVFEHGRTAPLWVAANRARSSASWQPARRPEVNTGSGDNYLGS